MKSFLTAMVIVVLSVSAHAREDYVKMRYSASERDGVLECARIASLLKQISSPEMGIKLKENCRLHTAPPVWLRTMARVGVAAGTWGVSEIGCAAEKDGIGCGPRESYIALEATVTTHGKRAPKNGLPLKGMGEEDCSFFSARLPGLHFTADSARLEGYCDNGIFISRLKSR